MKRLDVPQTADRRGHLTVITNPTPERRNHPSMLPPKDPPVRRNEPAALSFVTRQIIAETIRRWRLGAPMTDRDAQNAIDLLMGVNDGGAA